MGLIIKSNKRLTITCLLVILSNISNTPTLGQSLADSIKSEIEMIGKDNWNITLVSDSIIKLTYTQKVLLGHTQVRNPTDTIYFSLFFVIDRQKVGLEKCLTVFDSYTKEEAFSKGFDDSYWGNNKNPILPMIFGTNYRILVFDNLPDINNYVYEPDIYSMLKADIWDFIRLLADESTFCTYAKRIEHYQSFSIINQFGYVHWGWLRPDMSLD